MYCRRNFQKTFQNFAYSVHLLVLSQMLKLFKTFTHLLICFLVLQLNTKSYQIRLFESHMVIWVKTIFFKFSHWFYHTFETSKEVTLKAYQFTFQPSPFASLWFPLSALQFILSDQSEYLLHYSRLYSWFLFVKGLALSSFRWWQA